MKTSRYGAWLNLSSSVLCLLFALAFASPRVGAISLTLDPAVQNVGVGDSVDLAVRISGLGDHTAPSLGAFDLNVIFDPAKVQFGSVSLGDPALGNLLGPIVGSTDGFSVDSVAGLVNLFSFSLDEVSDLNAAQPETFTLASLHFTALAAGTGLFSLSDVVLGDAEATPLAADILGASVRIRSTGVPEALPWWSTALAFGVIGVVHHRRSRREIAR